MSIKNQVLASAAAAVTAFGAALTSSGASYALSVNATTDTLGHKVTITNNSVTDHSAKTATIVGTDENGRPQSETLAMPAGSTFVTSTKYFKTVATVTPSASTGADTFGIGIAAASAGPWIFPELGADINAFNVGIGVTVVSGTPNFTLQSTYDGVAWFNHATITGTSSIAGNYTSPILAYRMTFSAAGNATMTAIQTGAR